MKKPGLLNERDGSWSMRRALALLYALCSISCLVLSALNGMMAGVWAGAASMTAVLVLLGYTTLETMKDIALTLKDRRWGRED